MPCRAGILFASPKEAKRRFKRNHMVSLENLFLLTLLHSGTERHSFRRANRFALGASVGKGGFHPRRQAEPQAPNDHNQKSKRGL